MRNLTEDEVYLFLARAIQQAGSSKALAQQWSISAQFLCDVQHRRRGLTDTILVRLGLEKAVTYRKVKP